MTTTFVRKNLQAIEPIPLFGLLHHLSGRQVQYRDLPVARMKITAHSPHFGSFLPGLGR